MDIIAGKNGSFFVVNGNIDTDTVRKLSGISFEEFSRYNAWETMKKISHLSMAEYAAKNALRPDILEKFDRFSDAVDYKATQDLMFFIENENAHGESENDRDVRIIAPENFKNDFMVQTPREVSGLITDSVEIKNSDVPQMLKSIGTSISRSTISHFVKWNDITYKVDVIPSSTNSRKGAFNSREILIGENCYIFNADDWQYIKDIEYGVKKELKSRQNSWFRREKPEEEITNEIIKKICKNNRKQQIIYTALYKKYQEIKEMRSDYRGIFVHEFHHLKNKILLENRCLKPNTKTLQPEDMYYILAEDERSSHLAVCVDHLNQYWFNHNWETLLRREPCFEIIKDRSESERNRLLANLDFVTNAKLKHWTENHLEAHISKLIHRLPDFMLNCSVAKGLDSKRTEYLLMRSMIYSFRVYNPARQRYKITRLDKYIKIDIPTYQEVLDNIIARARSFIERKCGAKDMLKIKYGFSDKQIKKAAVIYDSALRIKRL
ncbi:MAG: hypothetical protein IJ689_07045 [Alphaproteobacteria bacterium]|nr:hypothetical protein [Alphaproteobacteria bacterium]